MIPDDKEELKKTVSYFLKTHELAVVATSSKSGQPEAATIGYMVDENFNFTFLTKQDSRKVKNILENPKVALVVGAVPGINTLQIEGEARLIYPKDSEYEAILLKTSQVGALYYGPILKMEGIKFAAVTVKTTWARWLDVNDLNGKEEFFQLIP